MINRGNNRVDVFHKDQDYLRFTEMIGKAVERILMRVESWCLIPNHFHLILRPFGDGVLSDWMQWLMNAYVSSHST